MSNLLRQHCALNHVGQSGPFGSKDCQTGSEQDLALGPDLAWKALTLHVWPGSNEVRVQRVPRAHHVTETLLLGSTLGETYSNHLAHND